MSAPRDASAFLAQPAPLPVALSLDLPAAGTPDHPVLSIPCTLASGEPGGPLSWQELLGER